MATDESNRYWSDPALRAKFFDVDDARPAATGASSTSTTSPACARRIPRSSRRRTGWRSRSCARGSSTGCASTTPTAWPTPRATCGGCADAGVEHVWVEKILDAGAGESLRDWPVDGTVGYEFLVDVAALFVDPAGEEPLTSLYASLTGETRPFSELAVRGQARAGVDDVPARGRPPAARAPRRRRRAAARRRCRSTAPTTAGASREDREVLERGRPARTCTTTSPSEWITRFQQTTPPVMAKGVEDTAFYRYVRLLALNDVGGDPGRFGITVEHFHAREPRARRALPAQPAHHPDARHEALGRRAGADRRAGGHGRRVGRRTCAAGSRSTRR